MEREMPPRPMSSNPSHHLHVILLKSLRAPVMGQRCGGADVAKNPEVHETWFTKQNGEKI